MKSTRRNHGTKICDICLGKDFLDMSIKSQMTIKKDKGVIFYQTKNLSWNDHAFNKLRY